MRKFVARSFLILITVIASIILFNLSLFSDIPNGDIKILAHRGVHQTFNRHGLTNTTCTARRIYPPTHTYIENTLPSIRAAFDYGADRVEIDVRRTADNAFAVFHDGVLDCRTNGQGKISDQTMAELRTLDAGYGYTADNGQTFPLRGKGVGMIPALDEVLRAFPKKVFQINIKSNNPKDADRFLSYLKLNNLSLPSETQLWSGPRFARQWRNLDTDIKIATKPEVKSCAKRYILIGWTGRVPSSCYNYGLIIPQNLEWLFWGWPRKTQARFMHRQVPVFLIGSTNGPREGIDTVEQLQAIPSEYKGWVMTNRIEIIGPALDTR